MTNFPTALDAFNNPAAGTPQNQPGYQHDVQHSNLNDAVAALQAKVGVNNSTVAASLDYRIGRLENTNVVVSVNGQIGAVTLNSDGITEGATNLYFTTTRARAALSVSAPLSYNLATGVVAITQAGQSSGGYLSQTDWNIFNNKQPAIGFTPLDIAGSNAMSASLNIAPTANASAVVVSGYSLTGSNAQAILDLSGTWNTTGQPTAIKLNLTDTSSSSFAVLLDLRVNGNSIFNVTKTGELTATYYLNTSGQYLMSGADGGLYLYYPATGHNAITADDSGQTLTFAETGSNYTRAQLTAYNDFVFFDSTNGNQPCFTINGDGSGVVSVGTMSAATFSVTSLAGTNLTIFNDDNYGGSCIQMSGDEYGGPIRLRLTDHNGANGAVFERGDDEIVDFIFLVGTDGGSSTQENIRFENRANYTTMGTAPEFRFGSDNDGWHAAISSAGIYTSGILWFDGMNTSGPPNTNESPSVDFYYGGNNNFLGDPSAWLYVNIDGSAYKMPLYQ
ncbi:MAG TPA: hypothetical protein VGY56_11270 [Verrucomicrobiae bacterium]|nr:hypothetical protein [Verrucomicrobiae bacterium]